MSELSDALLGRFPIYARGSYVGYFTPGQDPCGYPLSVTLFPNPAGNASPPEWFTRSASWLPLIPLSTWCVNRGRAASWITRDAATGRLTAPAPTPTAPPIVYTPNNSGGYSTPNPNGIDNRILGPDIPGTDVPSGVVIGGGVAVLLLVLVVSR